MGQDTGPHAVGNEDLHAQVLAIMEGLKLPAPARMLGRIEGMLPEEDRDRVLQALVRDSTHQPREETRRILKALVDSREEWTREVDRLLKNCPT